MQLFEIRVLMNRLRDYKNVPKSYFCSISLLDRRTEFKTTPENRVPSELVDDPPADHLSTKSCTLRLIKKSLGSKSGDDVAVEWSDDSEMWVRRHLDCS